jgi:hypothetical protein
MSNDTGSDTPLDVLLDDVTVTDAAEEVTAAATDVADAEPAAVVDVAEAADETAEGSVVSEPDPAIAEAAVAAGSPAPEPSAAPARPKQRARRQHRAPRPGGRHTKEAFWVRVAVPDGTSQFFPATDHIGKLMPFNAPQETCAMRVYPDAVCFSLLHLTKKAGKELKDRPVTIPAGPLSRLSRRVNEMELADGKVIVERRYEDEAGEQHDQAVELDLTIDGAGVATLDSADGEGDALFELGRRGERVSVYMISPKVPRRIALGWIGHLGRPTGNETMTRAAAKILNAASALPDFSLLTGIGAVDVPSLPGGAAVVRPTSTSVSTTVLARFFTDPTPEADPALVAEGGLTIEIDLEHANPAAGRLLFQVIPTEELAEAYAAYARVIEDWANKQLDELLGDDNRDLAYDIVLGSVSEGSVAHLSDKLTAIEPTDFTPTLCRARPS